MSNIYSPDQIDLDDLTFTKLLKTSSGRSFVYPSYEGGKLTIETPWLNMPYEKTLYSELVDKEDNNIKKYYFDVAFDKLKGSKDINYLQRNMFNLLSLLDNKIVESCYTYSSNWLGKDYSLIENGLDKIIDMYQPSIRCVFNEKGDIDVNTPPALRLKFSCKEDKYNIYIFDHKKDRVEIDNLVKDSNIKSIIQFSGLLFDSDCFGTTWNIVQAKVDNPEKFTTYSFKDNDEGLFVEDSDDEYSEENEEREVDIIEQTD